MKTTAVSLLIALFGLATARIGLGPCPTLPLVDLSQVSLTAGRWFINYLDDNMITAYKVSLQSPSLDCFAADITNTAAGFHWNPYKVIPMMKWCNQNVRCGTPAGTCNCYVYGKGYDIVYFDQVAQVAGIYQCWEFQAAYNQYINEFGRSWLSDFAYYFLKDAINDLHYSGLAVASMQPTITGDAYTRLTTFANSLNDQVDASYKAKSGSLTLAKFGGFNKKPTYSFTDMEPINQSETTCSWSTKP
jgi:hypothetical protein